MKKIFFLMSLLFIFSTTCFAATPMTCPKVSVIQSAHLANDLYGIYFFSIAKHPNSMVVVIPVYSSKKNARALRNSASSIWSHTPTIVRHQEFTMAFCSYKPGNLYPGHPTPAPLIVWYHESQQSKMHVLSMLAAH